jgi:type IV secretion system protein VirB2
MRRTVPPFTTKVRQFATQPAFTYALTVFAISITFPLQAHASPFDQGLMQMQTFFTGTLAKAASLIAIVIGGYSFAHGDPGAKRNLAGVAAGTGIAIMAANVLTWLWGS